MKSCISEQIEVENLQAVLVVQTELADGWRKVLSAWGCFEEWTRISNGETLELQWGNRMHEALDKAG